MGGDRLADGAEIRFKKIEKALEILAHDNTLAEAGEAVGRYERWVSRVRKEALNFEPPIFDKLSDVAKAYLFRYDPTLDKRLADKRRKYQSPAALPVQITANEQAKFKHWEDLAEVAAQIISFWDKNYPSLPTGGFGSFIVDEDEYESIKRSQRLYEGLLAHLKAEFSGYEDMNNWDDLVSIVVPNTHLKNLEIIADRRRFDTTCPICGDF